MLERVIEDHITANILRFAYVTINQPIEFESSSLPQTAKIKKFIHRILLTRSRRKNKISNDFIFYKILVNTSMYLILGVWETK